MTTISFDEKLELNKTHFKSLDDFENYLQSERQNAELSTKHQQLLDERLQDLSENPDDRITLANLKSSIRRS